MRIRAMITMVQMAATTRRDKATSARKPQEGARIHILVKKMRKPFQFVIIIVIAIAIGAALTSCHRGASTSDDTPDTSTYRPLPTPATEFEQKLKIVQDAHFLHVWVFTRVDGKEFTSEDSEALHTNAPKVVDWVGLDDRKTFIAGSNFPIEPRNLAVLQKRYKIEDLSGK